MNTILGTEDAIFVVVVVDGREQSLRQSSSAKASSLARIKIIARSTGTIDFGRVDAEEHVPRCSSSNRINGICALGMSCVCRAEVRGRGA